MYFFAKRISKETSLLAQIEWIKQSMLYFVFNFVLLCSQFKTKEYFWIKNQEDVGQMNILI